jgi:hypothetical protein
MKSKITLLVLAAALLVPSTLSAKISTGVKAFKANQSKNITLAKRGGDIAMPVKMDGKAHMLGMPKAEGETLVWDFEDEAQFSQFILEDKDGDGYNWQYYNNTGVESGQMSTHEGMGVISSASYVNDGNGGGTPVTPDNWLISPEVTLGGGLSFWAMGQDASYAAEVFGVFVSVDGENWTQVGADKTATSEYVLYEYDLSPYDGQAGQFAIVHHNVTDMFMLNVDDITFNPSGVVTPEPLIPTNVYVTPTATTGDVAWTPGDHNGSWDLRYRPYIDPALLGADWSMTIDNYQDISGQFSIMDADGDGVNWGLAYADEAQTEICFYSESWNSSNGALTPDNWLITPEVTMGGTLKFKTWNYSSSYLDQIAVYYAPTDWETTDDFIQISDILTPGTTAEEVEIDLSDYEGMGLIAFRHYDCEDMWSIYLDDIVVEVPGGVEPAEWNFVENVTNPYTIEGLTPETKYEVQVQAVSSDNRTTDWTESVIFTTLAEGEQPVEEINNLYLTGTFTDWSQNAEGCIAFEEVADGVFEAKAEIEAGGEFKIITFAEDGAITWFGGIDETEAGFYLITPELLNVPTALIDGSNFKMQEGAVYIIRVTEAQAQTAGIKGVAEPLQVEFIYYAPTAIENLNTDSKVDNTYYNLQGVKFNGMPSVPGIYINGGKKVIVK